MSDATTKKELLPPVLQIGSPILSVRAIDVPKERITTPEFQQLFATMIEVMRKAPGVGLAAPQIGGPWRVFVLEDREELITRLTPEERRERERVAFAPKIIVNPVVTATSDERVAFFEGCLSVDGYVGLVERAAEVEVKGLDEKGEPITWRVRGWPARILQHEHDHLEGTLYIDRANTRTIMRGELYKQRFGGKPIAEIRRELEAIDRERAAATR